METQAHSRVRVCHAPTNPPCSYPGGMPPRIEPYSLSEHKFRVLRDVRQHGALTTRRLVRDHGPKMTWDALIRDGYLRTARTMYGEVVGLSKATYQFFRYQNEDADDPADQRVDYLTGPTLLADRAFQNDALEILEREGYRVIARQYVNKQKKVVGNGRPEGHIVSYMLRVPAHVAELMAQNKFPVKPFDWRQDYHHLGQTGYPSLYASIGNGGIKSARLRALLRAHEEGPPAWKHPLIVALPQDHDTHDVLRHVALKHADSSSEGSGIWTGWSYIKERQGIPRLRIIELPRR